MAYYDIEPWYGNAERKNMVVGYKVNIVLKIGYKRSVFQDSCYSVVFNELVRRVKEYNHLGFNPNDKHCLFCGTMIEVHSLCPQHQGASEYKDRNGNINIHPYRPHHL